MRRRFLTLLLLFSLIIFLGARGPNSVSFVAIGDSGCGCDEQKRVAERMTSWRNGNPYEIVLTLGDNIYAGWRWRGGSKFLFQERFDQVYKPLLLNGVKFYATIGNHDLETNNGLDEIADKSRFHILQDLGYYSFSPDVKDGDRPLIQFIALNSSRLLKEGADPDQIAWLSRTLSESKAIWKVAYFHHPIYSPEGPHQQELGFRAAIEKILVASGVQVVLAGHSHYYARMKPQNGIVHFVSGGGGKDLKTPEPTPLAATSKKVLHFMYFEVSPGQMEFQAIPVEGRPFDQGAILPTPPM